MSMSLYPIPGFPALWIESLKVLVIADLHIGIENELRDQGVQVSSHTYQMKKNLLQICEKYRPRDIFIIGDIKHSIPATPFFEKKELNDFLSDLSRFALIHIIPGNHDGGINYLISEEIIIHSSEGYILDNIGFVHGHRWPKKTVLQCDYLIMGHSHPTILLKDRLGFQNFEPCWIKTGLNKIQAKKMYSAFNDDITAIILPAFNRLCGGIAVNRDALLGPLKKIIDLDHAAVFLLDGTHLGMVKEI